MQGSLITLFADPIFLSTVVVSADPQAYLESQQQALERAIVRRIETSLIPEVIFQPVCLVSREHVFVNGKAETEARLSRCEMPHGAKGTSDRNSRRRKERCGYPAGFSMNWILNVPHGHRVSEKHTVECKGGSLEVTIGSTGYVQGSGKKRNRCGGSNVLCDPLDPKQDTLFGFQSRLSRYEMAVLFLELCNKCMQQEMFGELLKDGKSLCFQDMKELNAIYRSSRRHMLSNEAFKAYLCDDPSDKYQFKLLI